jgi:hypothetical protein
VGEHVAVIFEYVDPATGRPWWHDLESGRTGWLIRGGSDTMGADAPAAGTEASAPVDSPPAPDGPEPDAPVVADKRPYEEWSQEELIREARKNQQQATKLKERFRPYEQAFDGIPTESVEMIGTFTRMIFSGDPEQVSEATAWMRREMDGLTPAEQAAVQGAADAASTAAGGDDDFDPFDRAAVEKLADDRAAAAVKAALEERDAQQTRQEKVAETRTKMDEQASELAKKLGMPELGVKGSEENEFLWMLVSRSPRGVGWEEALPAAAEKVQGMFAKHGQAYMQRKTAEADAPAASPEGEAPSGSKTPKTRKEAAESAKARLERLAQGVTGTT